MKQVNHRITALLCAGLVFLGVISSAAAEDFKQTALLVVAHGSHEKSWNDRVMAAMEKVEWCGPKGVALLTSSSPTNELPQVSARLDQPGVSRIVVVPLLVSSYSGHYEEPRYYAGLRKDLPGEPEEETRHPIPPPLKTEASLLLTSAMDSHAVITQILVDEVKPFATAPREESLVLVAHGPNADAENERWLSHLATHARRLSEHYGFRRVQVITLHDDAPQPVRDAATAQLYQTVEKAAADTRVLVLPVLISVGHIQKEIQKRLSGLDYTMVEGGLANSPLVAQWVKEQALAVLDLGRENPPKAGL